MGRKNNRIRSDSLTDSVSSRDNDRNRNDRRWFSRRRDSLDSGRDRTRNDSLDSRRRRRDSYDSRNNDRRPYEQPRYGGRDRPYDIQSEYSYYNERQRRNSDDSLDQKPSLKFEGDWGTPACKCFSNCTGICCAYCCPFCYICHLFQASGASFVFILIIIR